MQKFQGNRVRNGEVKATLGEMASGRLKGVGCLIEFVGN